MLWHKIWASYAHRLSSDWYRCEDDATRGINNICQGEVASIPFEVLTLVPLKREEKLKR